METQCWEDWEQGPWKEITRSEQGHWKGGLDQAKDLMSGGPGDQGPL